MADYTHESLLDEEAVRAALGELDGWSIEGDGIAREFRFADFLAALEFMLRVAPVAEELNHHPEWTNVYNRVAVRLTTHDSGGITNYDLRLAKAMNELAI